MNIDMLPIWGLFVGTILVVLGGIESGYLFGRMVLHFSKKEKESSATAVSGSVLALVAFMLAFTFGIVANRYDARKSLVREEAGLIRNAWLRSDVLPEPDRVETKNLLREYLRERVEVVQKPGATVQQVKAALSDVQQTHDRLWEIAVANARNDKDSVPLALYMESLNALYNIHTLRLGIAQVRVPSAIWTGLLGMTILGMMSVGYQSGIGGLRPSMARLILAFSFAVVIVLIAGLDRPDAGLIKVSQQPLIDLLAVMDASGN